MPGFSTGPPLVFTGYFAALNSARISSVGAGVNEADHHADGQHLAVCRGHRSRQDVCKDESGEAMPASSDEENDEIKKMTDYFAASPSGKMILFTKKKMTIEMPPLSTVVPML